MNRAKFKMNIRFLVPGIKFGVTSSDILEDILIYMAEEDKNGTLTENTGCFKNPKVIELIFLLSEFWCQDSATKYQAVEILDRFMILHTENLYNSSMKTKVTKESQADTWSSMKTSLSNMFLLHLVSCIQIASKLHFHCHIINNNMVLQFLQSAGYGYEKHELLQSELTILTTLNFRVNLLSPINYVDVLLEVLGHNGFPLPLEHLRDMCLKVLDLVYLLKNSIQKNSTDLSTASSFQRLECVSIKDDQMLLATAIIVASAYIIMSQDFSIKVLHKLNYITGIAVDSASKMSSTVLKYCLGRTYL